MPANQHPTPRPLTPDELHEINSRADKQGRTVQYVFALVGRQGQKRLRVVHAVIRDDAWVRAQVVTA